MKNGKSAKNCLYLSGTRNSLLLDGTNYFKTIKTNLGEIMLYEVKLKSRNGVITTDEINAPNEQSIYDTYKAVGKQVLEVVALGNQQEEVFLGKSLSNHNDIPETVPANLPPPNLEKLAATMPHLNQNTAPPPQQYQQMPPQQYQQMPPPSPPPQPQIQHTPHIMYFEDKGEKYKVIDGVAYKEGWVECVKDNYKIVKRTEKTEKDVTESVTLLKREWVKLAEQDEDE
jgi:hypothetical protein